MPKRYLVMQIGSLEYGHPSEVLGTYDTFEEAQAAHKDAKLRTAMDDRYFGDWWGGQVDVIYDLGEDDEDEGPGNLIGNPYPELWDEGCH